MKIERIRIKTQIILNDTTTLTLTKEHSGAVLANLLFEQLFQVNTDLMSKEFQKQFAKYGYEF